MNRKTDVEVLINNKKYVLCGYESTEYLEKIASYINRKIGELKEDQGYRSLDQEMRTVLLDINLADDYFKVVSQVKRMEDERENTNGDLFEVKHEVVKLQNELEQIREQYRCLQNDYQQAEKTIVELKTKLANHAIRND